jgi:hypothetical protein
MWAAVIGAVATIVAALITTWATRQAAGNAQNKKKIIEPKPPLANKVQPQEATKKLKALGYLARQNKQDQALWLDLGGENTVLNRDDFKGMVLLNPSRNLIFGTSPTEVFKLRNLTMEHKGEKEWRRKPGVPGPPNEENRVAVTFIESDDMEPRICCPTKPEPIWIHGMVSSLVFHQSEGYQWIEIEKFLEKLRSFCSQSINS